MKKYLAVLGLIIVTMIWGGGFVASDMALESMGPFQIMTVRFFLAAIIMFIIALKEIRNISKKEVIAGAGMGLALFLGFALQIVGLQYTTPSKNAFLTATNVVMVPFISLIFDKKKVSIGGIIGAVLSIFGVGILSLNRSWSLDYGDGLTLLCAVGFAVQIYLTGRYVKRYKGIALNMIQMLTAFLLSLAGMILFDGFHFNMTVKGGISVIYLGLASTALCYLLQTNCQKFVDETRAAIILSMESVFGTLFSIMILKERVTGRMALGCVIILIAVIIANATGKNEDAF